MDPLSILVMALAAGAAAGLHATAESVVTDAYHSLKSLIQRKFGQQDDIAALERNPGSKSRQDVIKEELAKTNAASDSDVLALAQAVLDAVRTSAPQAAATVGFSAKDIESASITLKDIIATGPGATGVIIEHVKTGDIVVEGVRAGDTENTQARSAHPQERQ
jgi:hypothetical protein